MPSIITVFGYLISFYCRRCAKFRSALYAIWSGVGIVLISIVAVLFKQYLTRPR